MIRTATFNGDPLVIHIPEPINKKNVELDNLFLSENIKLENKLSMVRKWFELVKSDLGKYQQAAFEDCMNASL